MNGIIKTLTNLFSHGFAWMGRHVHAMLFVFFVVIMVFAGFIFWQYGYQASVQEPTVAMQAVTTKEKELRALIEKMSERDASRSIILEKTFQDPFIKPETPQP